MGPGAAFRPPGAGAAASFQSARQQSNLARERVTSALNRMAAAQREAAEVLAREDTGTPAAPPSTVWVSVRELLLQGPIVIAEGDRNQADRTIVPTGLLEYDRERDYAARAEGQMAPYRHEARRRLLALADVPHAQAQRAALSEQLQLYALASEPFGIRDAGGRSLHLEQQTYRAYLDVLSSGLEPEAPPAQVSGEAALIDLGFSPHIVMQLLEREGGLESLDRVAALVPRLLANGLSVERIGDIAVERDGLRELERIAAGFNPAAGPAGHAGAAGGRSPHRPGWLR